MVKSKVHAILNGLKNYVFKDEELEKIAKDRAAICGLCEHLATDVYVHCKVCMCSIPLKIRSFEGGNKCPKDKWNK